MSALEKVFPHETPKLVSASGSGSELGLTFYVDSHAAVRFPKSKREDRKRFYLAINSPKTAFDVRTSGTRLRPGYHILIQVTAHQE